MIYYNLCVCMFCIHTLVCSTVFYYILYKIYDLFVFIFYLFIFLYITLNFYLRVHKSYEDVHKVIIHIISYYIYICILRRLFVPTLYISRQVNFGSVRFCLFLRRGHIYLFCMFYFVFC